jgi:hypothetical protein
MAAWNELVTLSKGVVLGVLTASVAGGIGLMSNIMKVHAGSSGGALCHTDGTQVVGWTDIAVSMAKPLTITHTSGSTSLALRATGGATAFNAFVTEDTGVRFESYESTSARIYDFRTYIGGDINSILISNTTGGWTCGAASTTTTNLVLNGSMSMLTVGADFAGYATTPHIGAKLSNVMFSQAGTCWIMGGMYYDSAAAWKTVTLNKSGAGLVARQGGALTDMAFQFYSQQNFASAAESSVTVVSICDVSHAGAWTFPLGNYPLTIGDGTAGTSKVFTHKIGGTADAVYQIQGSNTPSGKYIHRYYDGSTYTTWAECTLTGAWSMPVSISCPLIVASNGASTATIAARFNTSNAQGIISYYCSNGNPYFGLNTVQDASADTQKRYAAGVASQMVHGPGSNAWSLLVAASAAANSAIAWISACAVLPTGACSFGPSTSNDALTHIAYGSLFVGDVGAFNTVNYRNMGNTSGGFLLGNGRRDSYLYAGGYYNGTQWIAKQANIGIAYCTIYGPSAESSYVFSVNKFTDSTATDYTFNAGTSLTTSTELFAVYAEGSITVGSIVAAYRTYYGYSSSYNCMQIGPTISGTQSISLGCNPSTMATGGFSGDHIIIPYNISMIAANVAGNVFYGILKHDGTYLYLGGTNYGATASALRITASNGSVTIYGSIVQDDSGTGPATITMNSKTDWSSQFFIQEAGNQKWTFFNDAANDRFYLTDSASNDGVYIAQNATAWTANSDRRMKRKDSILPITDCLATICKIDPVYYLYNWDSKDGVPRQGFIAQDLFKVFPYAVDIGDTVNCMWGVTPTNMIPIIVGSIKELYIEVKKENERVKKENDSLRSRIEQLERRLAA